ncbi:MAG: hypothetical protein ABSC92_08215 [Rhizomicrobium sp.]
MTKPKGCRGIEFGLLTLVGGKTRWTIYPKKGTAESETGVVDGGDEEAEAVCKKVIDAALDP